MKLLSVFILLISSGLSFAQVTTSLSTIGFDKLERCEEFSNALNGLNSREVEKLGFTVKSECFKIHQMGSNVVSSRITHPMKILNTNLNKFAYYSGNLGKMCKDFADLITQKLKPVEVKNKVETPSNKFVLRASCNIEKRLPVLSVTISRF